jgi:hypothetical protein
MLVGGSGPTRVTASLLSLERPGKGVGDVAVRRRPVSVMPPPELFVFNSADWPGAYPGSFEAWRAARREWVKAHPDSPLGNMLDLLRGERKAHEELMGWKAS